MISAAKGMTRGLAVAVPILFIAICFFPIAPSFTRSLLILAIWMGLLAALRPDWLAPLKEYLSPVLEPAFCLLTDILVVATYWAVIAPAGIILRMIAWARPNKSASHWIEYSGREP